jgi:hypothetical protein
MNVICTILIYTALSNGAMQKEAIDVDGEYLIQSINGGRWLVDFKPGMDRLKINRINNIEVQWVSENKCLKEGGKRE